jgi:hypothetical protein
VSIQSRRCGSISAEIAAPFPDGRRNSCRARVSRFSESA